MSMALMSRRNRDAVPADASGPPSPGEVSVGKECLLHPLIAACNAVGASIAWVVERVVAHRAIVFALLTTVVFYTPSLRNGCRDAGYLFGGDVIDFHWPYVAKLQALLSRWQFTALDFGQFNGSSDFYLAANFFPFHPLFVGWALLTPADEMTIDTAGRFLCYSLAIHSGIVCYTTLRLLTRFYGWDFWSAAFAAAGYAFSIPMVWAHGQPMWVFCAAVVPWAAYAGLAYCEAPTVRGLCLAAFPVVVGYLAGYLPLGVACLGIAAIVIFVKVVLVEATAVRLSERLGRFVVAMLPFIVGSLIALPFMMALLAFLKETPSDASKSLFFSAHQLAECPQAWFRILSSRIQVPGPFFEFTPVVGFLGLSIALIFFTSSRAMAATGRNDWILLQVCWGLYGLVVLAIYGHYSPVSDLVWYFVPQIGRMHIYQRFLLPMQIALMIMLAVMLRCIIDTRPTTSIRVTLGILVCASAASAYAVGRYSEMCQSAGINNHVVFELVVAAIATAVLLMPGREFCFVSAIFLFSLPALDHMYDRSAGESLRAVEIKRQGVMLDTELRADLVQFMRRWDAKGLVKYVDITPRYTASGIVTFPKTFPDFVLQELKLSSYVGMNFYLSALKAYSLTIPYGGDSRFHPDWERLRAAGADLLVALEEDLPSLEPVTGSLAERDIFRLPNGVVCVPFVWARIENPSRPGVVFENGYFRLEQLPESADAGRLNLAEGKPARQSSNNEGNASLAVDGRRDGRFERGSVTHTASEPSAWWEVDLGVVEAVECIRIWNRRECPERLQDFYLIISEKPIAEGPLSASVEGWKKRVRMMPNPALTIDTPGVRGRYVRIQLSEPNPSPESILSLAEVEVLSSRPAVNLSNVEGAMGQVIECTSNDANYLRLEIDARQPLQVTYLLWPNPRLKYRCDGIPIECEWRDGLASIPIQAGRHVVEISYSNPAVVCFWVIYACYGLVVAWALLTLTYESCRAGVVRVLNGRVPMNATDLLRDPSDSAVRS